MSRTTRTETIRCVEDSCEFEFSKSYTGAEGTRGEAEYEASGAFDECPVCGGDIETVVNQS